MTVKAIETVYNGYRFRSRLEARWAVFFDAVGITYQYETEGFELSDGTRYLPDFYLPDMNAYVEVKADLEIAIPDIERAASMIQWGGPIHKIIILSNIPNGYNGGRWHFPVLYWFDDKVTADWFCFYIDRNGKCIVDIRLDDYYFKPFFFFYGEIDRLTYGGIGAKSEYQLLGTLNRKRVYGDEDKELEHKEWILYHDKIIFSSFDAARKARFEYGEHGGK